MGDEEKQQQVEEEDNKILLSTIPIRSRQLLKKYKMSALLMDALSPSELDLSLPIHSIHSIAVNEIHLMRDLFMDHLLRTMLHSSLTNGHLSTKYDIGAVLLQKDKKENNDNDNNTEKKNETDCISVQDIEACMSLVASAECMSRRNGLGLSTYTEVMLKATKVIHYIRCSLKFQNSNDLTKSLENEACRNIVRELMAQEEEHGSSSSSSSSNSGNNTSTSSLASTLVRSEIKTACNELNHYLNMTEFYTSLKKGYAQGTVGHLSLPSIS